MSLRGRLPAALLAAALVASAYAGAARQSRSVARPVAEFLDSIGVNSAIAARGETLEQTIECARYLGVRWFRSGTEGGVPISSVAELHKRTGVRFSWSPGSGGSDLPKLIATAKEVAAAGALLAFEGPNEPNNWQVTYQGQRGGGSQSWMPVAKLQAELYRMVKADPTLGRYPVWSITEGGAETDNVGLQYLTIPDGAGTLMPAGTKYADAANVHNYVYHPNVPGLADNKTWDAADPSPVCRVDGLFGEYGRTWARHFAGYSGADLRTLPRVTTETGCLIDVPVTEDIHALNLLTLYLDQFKRGWSHTAVYLLRDRVDEAGNQKFGFYRPDYSPRKAALYLHNLTTILADRSTDSLSGTLGYTIPDEPATVHDLLLRNGSGTYYLVVWGERLSGTDQVAVRFDAPVRSATLFDPTLGTAAISALHSVRAIPLALTDHPIVIELTH